MILFNIILNILLGYFVFIVFGIVFFIKLEILVFKEGIIVVEDMVRVLLDYK